MNFEDIIRNEIKASGMTAKELSVRCGISEQALHQRISRANMKVSSLQQMSDILKRNLFKALSKNYDDSANH